MADKITQANEALQVQVAEISMQAINTLLNISIWVLGILAVLIAVVSISGWVAIRSAAVQASKDLAGDRLDDYLKGNDFEQLIEEKLSEAVERKTQNTVIVQRIEVHKQKQGESEFPSKPGDGDDNF